MKQLLIKAQRNRERKEEIHHFLFVVSSFLSMPLFLTFWIADLLYVPHLKWEFLQLRALMIPIGLLTNALNRKVKTLNQVQILGSFFILANSGLITIMIFWAEGISSPYYAGLNLVCLGLVFLPWNNRFLIGNILLIFGPYFVLAPFVYHSLQELFHFGVNSFFIGGTIIASVVIRTVIEKLRVKEVMSRIELKLELKSREKIIQQKTSEAVALRTLTKQFSPQVVHSIQSGALSLSSEVKHAHICAVFIDIVNSTQKIRTISLEDSKTILSKFMEDVSKVLLKYDLTIDKFLGDGVLAFSNAPNERPDYILRVVDAAFEVKTRLELHQSDYTKLWKGPFEIRVGIACGEANVGFFGNDEAYRSYTAIGEVVNFASRLCDHADKNQILMDGEAGKAVGAQGYLIKETILEGVKGFEGGESKVFALTGHPEDKAELEEIEVCPYGHGVLHLDTNAKGHFLFMCRTCGYELQMEDLNKKNLKHAA